MADRTLLLPGLLALGVLSGLILAFDPGCAVAPVRQVQHSLGGLGLGAVTVPAWTFRAYDPRLDPTCDSEDFPVPGLPCYAPDDIGPIAQFATPPALEGIPRLTSNPASRALDRGARPRSPR